MGTTPVKLTYDHEVRVIACEYASKMIDYSNPDTDKFLDTAAAIENYIKDGKRGGT